jgi:hypothetical protein
MHQYFTKDIGQRHVCLLHGLGGSGKTQIALKFLAETDNARCTFLSPIQLEPWLTHQQVLGCVLH